MNFYGPSKAYATGWEMPNAPAKSVPLAEGTYIDPFSRSAK
jgi:hypothetical protein